MTAPTPGAATENVIEQIARQQWVSRYPEVEWPCTDTRDIGQTTREYQQRYRDSVKASLNGLLIEGFVIVPAAQVPSTETIAAIRAVRDYLDRLAGDFNWKLPDYLVGSSRAIDAYLAGVMGDE